MIGIEMIRKDPEAVKASQRTRGEDPELVSVVHDLDEAWRTTVRKVDELRQYTKKCSQAVKAATPEGREAALATARTAAAELKHVEEVAAKLVTERDEALRRIPNIVEAGVPEGGEDDYRVLSHVGEIPQFEHPARDHVEIGKLIGAIDLERGARTSGSRFYYLTGIGARLERAIVNLALDTADRNGFTQISPPVLVRPEAMEGTGFLGAHADEVYRLEADDLYLVGTSEVPLAAFHAGEILDRAPQRYVATSTCFRREAGSHGKDTRGIFRVHQFEKVEMFTFTTPDEAGAEHQRLLGYEKELLALLELPYRIIDVAAGDLGTSAARKYDCEAWIPSQGRYREVTSTSNCTTFQANHLKVRYRDENGKPQTAATLNGTLAAIPRLIVAILENHQQADGTVKIPAALQPYLGGLQVAPLQ